MKKKIAGAKRETYSTLCMSDKKKGSGEPPAARFSNSNTDREAGNAALNHASTLATYLQPDRVNPGCVRTCGSLIKIAITD
jgi:hypothetical protein